MQQIKQLNLVYSYPVKWTKFQIFRDFIQNFYDELKPEQWKESFHFHYDSGNLSLAIEHDGFSYEWLLSIGASTKTDSESSYAGHFGEGFKIAALCAHRDCGWGVQMSSRDWTLTACKDRTLIDGQSIDVLAYRIKKNKPLSGSILKLTGISEIDYRLFLVVLDCFYYPENKLLGKPIWKTDICAVYERSRCHLSKDMPVTEEFGKSGAVFCSYQLLGTNPLPLVFCLHNYECTDRERKELQDFEVIDIILKISVTLSPESAAAVLEKMKRFWYRYPKKKKEIEVNSWSPVINALIRRIRLSESVVTEFKKKYPNLLCAARTNSNTAKILRHQAIIWMRSTNTQYRLVKNTFCLLGYRFLETECQLHNGFAKSERAPIPLEKECYRILKDLISLAAEGFFGFKTEWPELHIITNSESSCEALSDASAFKEPVVNSVGLKIRFNINRVYLKAELFTSNRFYDALSTYTHELCYTFGSEGSVKYNQGLTIMIELLVAHNSEVEMARMFWESAFLS